MKKVYLLVLVMFCSIVSVFGQNSAASGNWNSSETWAGETIPNTNGTSGSEVNITHEVTLTGDLENANGRTINVKEGGILNITGNLILKSPLRIFPGGKVVVDGSVNIFDYETLFIGTTTGGTIYADMVIRQNLVYEGGVANVDSNGRLAIFGDVKSNTDGGVDMNVKAGGQVYINGDIALTGGGDAINNDNLGSHMNPYGLYVNGTATSTGGGGNVDNNVGTKQQMYDTNRPFADWVFGQLNITLPVNLLYFTATPQSQSIDIIWASSKAWDFSHYELERSADGTTFEYVATIDAAEFSNETVEYSYSDRQPLFGTSYYRLKAVDVDGAFEYKEMAAVKFGAESFKVYPNPSAQGFITVRWSHAGEGATVSLKDNTGRTIRSIQLNRNSDTISTEGLATGVYFLSVEGAAGQKQAQVLIR